MWNLTSETIVIFNFSQFFNHALESKCQLAKIDFRNHVTLRSNYDLSDV